MLSNLTNTTSISAENDNTNNDQRSSSTSFIRHVIQLRRLLSCIAKTNGDTDVHILHLSARTDLARQLLYQIQDLNDATNKVSLLTELENKVKQACARTYLEISRRRSLVMMTSIQQHQSSSQNLHDIFFSNQPHNTQMHHSQEYEKENDTEDMQQADHGTENSTYHSPKVVPEEQHGTSIQPSENNTYTKTTTSADEVLLLSPMESTIEEEIAEMAHQLKVSTLSVNETLRIQTKELSSMEELATQNLERVTNVTDTVSEHVRRQRWTKILGTWALLVSVLATFCMTFVVVRVVPKRHRVKWTNQQPPHNSHVYSTKPNTHERRADFSNLQHQHRDTPFSHTTCQYDNNNNEDVAMECNANNNQYGDKVTEKDDKQDVLLWQLLSEKKRQRIAANTAVAEGELLLDEKEKMHNRNNEKNDDAMHNSEYYKEEGDNDTPLSEDNEWLKEEEERLGTILRHAAAHGDVSDSIIDRCIEENLINSVDENGWTALHEAVRSGSAIVVERLIHAGADIHAVTGFGQTPLQIAVGMYGKDHHVSQVLLRRRMDA